MTLVPPSFNTLVPGADQPVADLTGAPLPTTSTLKQRRSLVFQFTRFASLSLRIMRMVIKGHH
ncbi:MAG: hypothetical protein HZY73_02655 [Micropruina sp.]|nr:MAG: hypothetical protein HZY73_02655 [Micropruina sp.]